MSVIRLKHISKNFGSGHTSVAAITDLSLDIEAGDIILVMGPSGSGKTTLISMIGTLMRPSSGQIIFDSEDTSQLKAAKLADLRLNKFGFVFQSFNLLAALSAEENVLVPLLAANMSKNAARHKARAMLEKMGLGDRMNHRPAELSGGEKQRVAIARALINQPKVILADEPTANLDSATGQEVTKLLCSIACTDGQAVVIVSHDPRLKEVAKRVITIADGKLIGEEKGNHDASCPHRK